MGCADQTRGRPGQDRLDRLQPCDIRADQGAVAAHHHRRGADAQCVERTSRRVQQVLNDRHEPGVEHAGHRPARAVEPARQLVTARDRKAGALAKAISNRDLVLRIAHREHAGDREGGDRSVERGERAVEGGDIQRRARLPGRIVTAADPDAGTAAQRIGDSGPRRVGLAEADEHQAHPSALPFDERVGRKRGGERDERDGGGIDARALQHRPGGAVNSDREVAARGERLRRRHDLSGPLVVQHRVGVRAAGVDSEQDGHGRREGAQVKGVFESTERAAERVVGWPRLPATQSYVRRPAETGSSDRGSAESRDPRYALRPGARSRARQSARR